MLRRVKKICFSFDDEIDGAVNSNLVILAIGCSAIFIYIGAVLGKLNWLEQRVRKFKTPTQNVIIKAILLSNSGLLERLFVKIPGQNHLHIDVHIDIWHQYG